jgi:hypothetical protein
MSFPELPREGGEGYLTVKIDREGVRFFCRDCQHGGGEYFERRDAPKGQRDEPKEVYDYVDEDGKRLFQSLRFEPIGKPKYFRQRTGPDQRKWSIKGVRIVPYRLPELIEDISQEHTIFVVEARRMSSRSAIAAFQQPRTPWAPENGAMISARSSMAPMSSSAATTISPAAIMSSKSRAPSRSTRHAPAFSI